MIKAAVIVPTYNAAQTLPTCLEALLSQQLEPEIFLEILVVDDGSTDNTACVARCYMARGVRFIRTCHRGAAAARNAGIKAASQDCTILLFTDADCRPALDWASQMINALDGAGEKIAGVKGRYQTCQQSPIARFVQSEFEERYTRFVRLKVQPDFADTYSAAFRRHILDQQPFDESLPGAIVEDAELGWRLRQAGYSFEFAPQAVVYHQHPSSLLAYFRRKFRIGRWRMILYRRYPALLSGDSHTSQLAKLQMLLLGASFASLLLAIILRLIPKSRSLAKSGLLASVVCFGVLQLSFGPFIRRLRRNSSGATGLAWLLLNLRAAGFTFGALTGLVQLIFETSSNPPPYKSPGRSAGKPDSD
jgi:cellulose synthase/poly-beta-1,6-N-acetylglucosamine synthase-like glycosyltransferase